MNYLELMNEIYTNGKKLNVRGNRTKELIDCTLEINNINLICHTLFRDSYRVKRYLMGELAWYLSGNLKSAFIEKYSSFWKSLINDDKTLNSNYGHHVFYKQINKKHNTPFTWCIKQLTKDAFSRQAVVLYNENKYFTDDNKDFICTQLQHFLIRDDKLISLVYVRSSDLILGLTYDIPWWSLVQQQLWLTLKLNYPKLKLGSLIVHGGSFHLYENKFEMVKNMLKYPSHFCQYTLTLKKIIPLYHRADWYQNNLERFIEII